MCIGGMIFLTNIYVCCTGATPSWCHYIIYILFYLKKKEKEKGNGVGGEEEKGWYFSFSCLDAEKWDRN